MCHVFFFGVRGIWCNYRVRRYLPPGNYTQMLLTDINQIQRYWQVLLVYTHQSLEDSCFSVSEQNTFMIQHSKLSNFRTSTIIKSHKQYSTCTELLQLKHVNKMITSRPCQVLTKSPSGTVPDKLVGCCGLPGKLSIRTSPMEVWADLDRKFISKDASDLVNSDKTQLCLWTNLPVTPSQERIAKYESTAMQCPSDQWDLAASWQCGWHVCIAVSTWGGIDEASCLWAASFLSSSVFCSSSHSRSLTVIIPISHVDK